MGQQGTSSSELELQLAKSMALPAAHSAIFADADAALQAVLDYLQHPMLLSADPDPEEWSTGLQAHGSNNAALLLEECPAFSVEQQQRLVGLAGDHGIPVIRLLGRQALRVDPRQLSGDFLCLDGSLAAGLPFGAVISHAALAADAPDPSSPSYASPSREAIEAVAFNLNLVQGMDLPGKLAAQGEILRQAFKSACVQHDIQGDLVGHAAAGRWCFRGQENADGPRIMQAWLDELRTVGIQGSECMVIPTLLTTEELQQAQEGIRYTVGRLRTLLIELNSYISGGLRYPFADAGKQFQPRGLAIYRFPARGLVKVEAVDDAINIRFAAHDLGEVTSSGFYVPTLVSGDFTVSIAYRLLDWQPHTVEPACLALFAQNLPSTNRYYAQRMSTLNGPQQCLGSYCGELSARQEVQGDSGHFRITRQDKQLCCWHRSNDQENWQVLGDPVTDSGEDMILGAKIWSKLRCEGLHATLTDLQIQGQVATEQIPPVPIKEDPSPA